MKEKVENKGLATLVKLFKKAKEEREEISNANKYESESEAEEKQNAEENDEADKEGDKREPEETPKGENTDEIVIDEEKEKEEKSDSIEKNEDSFLEVWKNRPEKESAASIAVLRDLCLSEEGSTPLARNLSNSLKLAEGLREGLKASREFINNIIVKILDMAAEAASGILSADFISLISKGINYDKHMEKAFSEGEINGRNAAIEEKLESGGKAKNEVPALGGTATSSDARRPSTIFDLASFAR
ncbi:MAG: hypothetical protein NC328_05970 [Muribaculum sp.]|nr:hypothetical protein [Muribaculum sp.]